jgi:ABC-type taurine transport system ATPase subunit
MREAGTIILLATWALSAAYLIAEKLIVRKPLPGRIQWVFIRVGITGMISGFALYFIGG